MALRNAEHALLGDQLGAVGAGHRLALVGRQLVGSLRRGGPTGAQRADDVRHPPDAVLVGDQQIIVLPGEAVRPVQILDMAADPLGAPLAVITQQGQVAPALLGNQHIAVGQDQRRRGLTRPVAKGVAVKPGGTCRVWPLNGIVSTRLVTIGPVFGGGNSAASMRYALADLVLGLEVLRQHLGGVGVGCRFRGALHHPRNHQHPDHRAAARTTGRLGLQCMTALPRRMSRYQRQSFMLAPVWQHQRWQPTGSCESCRALQQTHPGLRRHSQQLLSGPKARHLPHSSTLLVASLRSQ